MSYIFPRIRIFWRGCGCDTDLSQANRKYNCCFSSKINEGYGNVKNRAFDENLRREKGG